MLVDFWAPWCGPCKQLTPVIEKAVRAAEGKVKLVKMNIDEHPQIAGQLGIQSIPAVFAFQNGQPVDGFMGALPESQVKGFIERLVGPLGAERGRGDDGARPTRLAAEGDAGGAAELYARRPDAGPGASCGALAGLGELHLNSATWKAPSSFSPWCPRPSRATRRSPARAPRIELAEQAASLGDLASFRQRVAANPLDHQARFDLALGLNAQGQARGSRRSAP